MTVRVCVGSSCHLKGSAHIIALLKEAISNHHLEDKVELAASFCLGHCTDGVSMTVDDELVLGVSPENFEQIFNDNILAKL